MLFRSSPARATRKQDRPDIVHYPRGRGQVARCRSGREESWLRLRTPARSRFPVEAALSPGRAVPARAARKQDRLARKHILGRAEFNLSVSRRRTQASMRFRLRASSACLALQRKAKEASKVLMRYIFAKLCMAGKISFGGRPTKRSRAGLPAGSS